MRYLVLDSGLVLLSLLVAWRWHRHWSRRDLLLAAVLLIATWLFDSYLTGLPIVRYVAVHHLPVRLGSVPIEDFGYTIAAIILLPTIYAALIKKYYGSAAS